MKVRDQAAMNDGFDKNVAQKMPKLRKEELSSLDRDADLPRSTQEPLEATGAEEKAEKPVFFPTPKPGPEKGKPQDVMNLIEDLHAQLLAVNQTKRALETDLSSSHKTVQQLVQDNNELRRHLDELRIEIKKLTEEQTEAAYLREENGDALEKIKGLQQEVRDANEALAQITQQRDEAISRALELESQIEQIEVLRIKGKLREREASHFSDENSELRSRLEELQLQNIELEREHEDMKRSFNEVKESLTFLRDSCKAHYYNLSDSPEQ